MAKKRKKSLVAADPANYGELLAGISELLDQARRGVARTVNSILTATYWEVGRRIVEHEQGGKSRAEYGEELLKRLGEDLTKHFGRGFSRQGLQRMRVFFLGWQICSTPLSKLQARVKLHEGEEKGTGTVLVEATLPTLPLEAFPLAWSHYIRLMSVPNFSARAFYEEEAIRGGWSVRQLDRQIATQFFERLSASKQKEAMLARSHKAKPGESLTAEEVVRDPYILEFLDLKDEYAESDLEEAIIRNLEAFLLELGAGFTFVARQKRIRIGTEWYRMDLLLYHRRLRCLCVIDLKLGRFTHADAGQMNLYLNYTKEHLTEAEENPPVGIILCSEKDDTVVEYAMGGINARVFASQYLTSLPSPDDLRAVIEKTRRDLQSRLLPPESTD